MKKERCTKSKSPLKIDQPLTVGGFLEGLDKFYDGKIKPQFVGINQRIDEHDRQFVGINQQFVVINQHLDEHDKKFNEIYNHIDGLYKIFDDLKTEYYAIKAALDRIESYIKEDVKDKKMIRQEITKIKSDIKILSARVDDLEKKMAV